MNDFGKHVISNELNNGFTTEFLDQPAIPPFLMNSDFMQMDRTTKVESDDLQNATDDSGKLVNTDSIISSNPAEFSQPNVYLIPTNIDTNIGQVIHISNHNIVHGNTTTNKKTNSKSDNIDDSMSKEEIELFAKEFKEKRVTLGFTQVDVSVSLADMFDHNFSQTTICRFEALALSHNNMCRLYPFLVKWLSEADNSVNVTSQEAKTTDTNTPSNTETALVSRKRKRRASIDKNLRISLESFYMENPRPGAKDLNSMSAQLNVDRGVIRVWFCNRRQREKKNLIAEYVNLNEKSIFIQSFNINELNTLNNSIVSLQETKVSENMTTDNLASQNISEYSDESEKIESQFENENEYIYRNIIDESEVQIHENEYIITNSLSEIETHKHKIEYIIKNTSNESEVHKHENENIDENTLNENECINIKIMNESEAYTHKNEYNDKNTSNKSETHIHENEYIDKNTLNENKYIDKNTLNENEYLDKNTLNESENVSNQLETIMECTEKFIDNMDDYEIDHSDVRMEEESHMHLHIS